MNMANIIIFHSVLGITRGIVDFSEKLKEKGHQVFAVDLYNGKSFDDMQEAFDYFLSIGIPEMVDRTIKYTKDLPHDAIYIGFSNGGSSAMLLAGTKPGAKGCILLHAALPIKELGIENWPSNVPVEVHYAKVDPWKDEKNVAKLTNDIKNSGASYQYYEYSLEGHLFTDAEMHEYNKESADLLFERVLSFINQFE
ncbi:MAG: dienelactone hydrolase family protein [Methanobacteriaceae archaeon]|nr:dienelactone hydrolase family protein [Methanobacteriaceae archaeon]